MSLVPFVQYDERMVGENSPDYTDTLNRPFKFILSESGIDDATDFLGLASGSVGNGDPEGSVLGRTGDIYGDRDATSGVLWVKTSGINNNIGWRTLLWAAGTAGKIPKFSTLGSLIDSIMTEAAGTITVGGALTVNTTLTVTGVSNLNGNVILGDAAADTLSANGVFITNLIPSGARDIGSTIAPWQDGNFSRDINIGRDLTVTRNTVLNGNVSLGDAAADTISANGVFITDLIPSGTRNLGSIAAPWNDGYFGDDVVAQGNVYAGSTEANAALTLGSSHSFYATTGISLWRLGGDAEFNLGRVNTSFTAPTPPTNAQILSRINFTGYVNSTIHAGARIYAQALQTWTNGARGTKMVFSVTALNDSGTNDEMILTSTELSPATSGGSNLGTYGTPWSYGFLQNDLTVINGAVNFQPSSETVPSAGALRSSLNGNASWWKRNSSGGFDHIIIGASRELTGGGTNNRIYIGGKALDIYPSLINSNADGVDVFTNMTTQKKYDVSNSGQGIVVAGAYGATIQIATNDGPTGPYLIPPIQSTIGGDTLLIKAPSFGANLGTCTINGIRIETMSGVGFALQTGANTSQFGAKVQPSVTGIDLGTTALRWDVFAQDIDISGTITLSGSAFIPASRITAGTFPGVAYTWNLATLTLDGTGADATFNIYNGALYLDQTSYLQIDGTGASPASSGIYLEGSDGVQGPFIQWRRTGSVLAYVARVESDNAWHFRYGVGGTDTITVSNTGQVTIYNNPLIVNGINTSAADLTLAKASVTQLTLGSLLATFAGDVTITGDNLNINGQTYTWPSANTANRVLRNSGPGTLSWSQVNLATDVTGALATGTVPAAQVTNGTFADASTYTFLAALAVNGTITSGVNATAAGYINNGAAGQNRDYVIRSGGVNRWIVRGSATAEGGANAGTLFQIIAVDDSGSTIDTPFQITRAVTGDIVITRAIVIGTDPTGTQKLRVGGLAHILSTTANQLRVAYSTTQYWDFNITSVGGLELLPTGTTFNLAVFAAGSYGGGKGVIFIANATTVPTTNPTGGPVLYCEAGAVKVRGTSGTVTTLAPA